MDTLWCTFSEFCKRHSILRWLFVSRDDRVMIVQWPNLPLWIAIVLALITMGTHGAVSQWTRNLEVVVLVYWSILEIGWGDSRFRRLLGVYVLIMQVVHLVKRV